MCDIDTETITSPPGYWTGLEERSLVDSYKRDSHLTDDPAEACLGNHNTSVLWQDSTIKKNDCVFLVYLA